MLICPNCNNQVEENARFCRVCGVQFLPIDGAENVQSNIQATTVLSPNMMPQYANQNQENGTQAQPNQNTQQQMYPPSQQHIPQTNTMPLAQLKTNRSFIRTLLLSMITFGIYGLITYGQIADDVNLVCSRYDGKKSMNYYLLFFLVGPLTLGIAMIVWMHNICNRIGNEIKRRQIDYNFSAKDFWLWGVLGSFIIVGPFIFAHKFFTSVNKMNEHFNING